MDYRERQVLPYSFHEGYVVEPACSNPCLTCRGFRDFENLHCQLHFLYLSRRDCVMHTSAWGTANLGFWLGARRISVIVARIKVGVEWWCGRAIELCNKWIGQIVELSNGRSVPWLSGRAISTACSTYPVPWYATTLAPKATEDKSSNGI